MMVADGQTVDNNFAKECVEVLAHLFFEPRCEPPIIERLKTAFTLTILFQVDRNFD